VLDEMQDSGLAAQPARRQQVLMRQQEAARQWFAERQGWGR